MKMINISGQKPQSSVCMSGVPNSTHKMRQVKGRVMHKQNKLIAHTIEQMAMMIIMICLYSCKEKHKTI